eukprot:1184571-Prorocentrum_minimum.AAC.2
MRAPSLRGALRRVVAAIVVLLRVLLISLRIRRGGEAPVGAKVAVAVLLVKTCLLYVISLRIRRGGEAPVGAKVAVA